MWLDKKKKSKIQLSPAFKKHLENTQRKFADLGQRKFCANYKASAWENIYFNIWLAGFQTVDLSEKIYLLSSKTALFVFIHVDMILHTSIFRRNTMFSLSNLLSDMRVENSDLKQVLPITWPNLEATRDHVIQEQLVWLLRLSERSSCNSSSRKLVWGPRLESLHIFSQVILTW